MVNPLYGIIMEILSPSWINYGEAQMGKQRLRVALIGYRFMGKLHSHAYHTVQQLMNPAMDIEMAVLCGRDQDQVAKQAHVWGWRESSNNWAEVVSRPDIDAVDIAVPGEAHAAIAELALRHGKHVLCEKPLANTMQDSIAMVLAQKKAGAVTMVGFNYRRAPAVQLAHQLIASGQLGKIFHVRGQYLQDWAIDPAVPLTWRFQQDIAGSGSLGDLLTHVIDLTHFLVGDFERVSSMQQRFIESRPLPGKLTGEGLGHAGEGGTGETGPVTVDDVTAVLAELSGGAVGVFEATRFATGYKNGLRLEIHGDQGAVRFDLERMNELEYYAVERGKVPREGFRRILATHPEHPYMKYWWPEGHIVGYEVTFAHQIYDWVDAIANHRPASPDFADGLRCQEVVDAIVASTVESRITQIVHQNF